jgi:hypothetical protein
VRRDVERVEAYGVEHLPVLAVHADAGLHRCGSGMAKCTGIAKAASSSDKCYSWFR